MVCITISEQDGHFALCTSARGVGCPNSEQFQATAALLQTLLILARAYVWFIGELCPIRFLRLGSPQMVGSLVELCPINCQFIVGDLVSSMVNISEVGCPLLLSTPMIFNHSQHMSKWTWLLVSAVAEVLVTLRMRISQHLQPARSRIFPWDTIT